jgi:hypothetical protein
MKFRFGAIALALLLMIAATGCGSKKKAAVTTSAPPPATTTTSSGGSTTPTTTSSSTGKSPSFASAKDCAQLEGLGQKFSAAIAASATGKTPNYDEEIKLFQALADAAPSAIHGDLETISDAFAAEVGALKKANLTPGKTPTPAQLATLASASKSFSSAKVQAASKHLEAYGESHCGVKG